MAHYVSVRRGFGIGTGHILQRVLQPKQRERLWIEFILTVWMNWMFCLTYVRSFRSRWRCQAHTVLTRGYFKLFLDLLWKLLYRLPVGCHYTLFINNQWLPPQSSEKDGRATETVSSMLGLICMCGILMDSWDDWLPTYVRVQSRTPAPPPR